MSSVAVVIVNYNAAELAMAAVESVRDKAPEGTEIHLVDNASPDGNAAVLAEAHEDRGWGEQVTLYLEDTNHGFGRGNNVVFDALARRPDPPDYVFLLNPDAQLKNDAVSVLADFLDAHAEVAVAGPRIKAPDGAPAAAAFQFPSVFSEFANAICFGPVSRLFRRWQVSLPPEQPTSEVDWVSGAAFMARLDVIGDMQGFDPDFFLYYEEVELMHRIKRAGLQVWHVAEAQVTHIEGATTGIKGEAERHRRPAYWYDSWHLYFRKTRGRAYALGAGVAWLTGAALNHGISWARRRPAHAPLRLFPDFWARVGRPLLGLPARPVRQASDG